VNEAVPGLELPDPAPKALLPLCVPWKPIVVDPPAGIEPL